jgi:hypothetical protein
VLITSPSKETTMPLGTILSKQAIHTLTQLHAELAGKIEGNRKSGDKLRMQMMQVEAVMKMLNPEVNLRAISVKRRNVGNPWFKRGTLYRAALDVLRQAEKPLTAREMMLALLEGKEPQASRKQELDLQAAILATMRKRSGKSVEGVPGQGPVRWRLIGPL